MCWSAELRTSVKAASKWEAYDKVEEMRIAGDVEAEFTHKVHEEADRVKTVEEVVNEEEVGERPNYLKLDQVCFKQKGGEE